MNSTLIDQVWENLSLVYPWDGLPRDLFLVTSDLFKEEGLEDLGNTLLWCLEHKKWPTIWSGTTPEKNKEHNFLKNPGAMFSWWLNETIFLLEHVNVLPKKIYRRLPKKEAWGSVRNDYVSVRMAVEALSVALHKQSP